MIESPHKHFKLQSIKLRKTSFEVMDSIDEVIINDDGFTVQSRRGSGWKYLKRVENDASDLFEAEIGLGIRLIEQSQESGNNPYRVVYSIEAVFAVIFEVIDSSFDPNELGEFADRNGTHLVWPYWRQFVSQTLQAACIPQLTISLLAPVMKKSTASAQDD